MSIGERLKKLRLSTKNTLKEMSDVLGVSVNSVYRWEHNLTFPRNSMLKKIADYYNVPLEWLLNGSSIEESVKCGGVLSPENNIEIQLLRMYKKLSNKSQYKILGYVERIFVEEMDESINVNVQQIDNTVYAAVQPLELTDI